MQSVNGGIVLLILKLKFFFHQPTYFWRDTSNKALIPFLNVR